MSDDDNYIGYDPEWDDDEGDEFGDFSPPDPDKALLQELMDTYGYADVGEIVINLDKVQDVSNIRGNRFSSILEAVLFLHDIGVLGFSHVVYLGEDEYGAEVPDKSP